MNDSQNVYKVELTGQTESSKDELRYEVTHADLNVIEEAAYHLEGVATLIRALDHYENDMRRTKDGVRELSAVAVLEDILIRESERLLKVANDAC